MKTVPYGAWPSPITADLATGRFVSFGGLKFSRGRHYWLEQRPATAAVPSSSPQAVAVAGTSRRRP